MQIIDRREIEFDAISVVRAIAVSSKAARAFGLPGLAPLDVRFHPSEGMIDVLYGTRQSPQVVSISSENLGALLVSYCIRARIPIPKKADKGIRLEASCIFLAFRTKYDEVPTPGGAEPTIRADEPVIGWTWLHPERMPTAK